MRLLPKRIAVEPVKIIIGDNHHLFLNALKLEECELEFLKLACTEYTYEKNCGTDVFRSEDR